MLILQSVSLARLTCVCLEDAPAINALVLEFVLGQLPRSAMELEAHHRLITNRSKCYELAKSCRGACKPKAVNTKHRKAQSDTPLQSRVKTQLLKTH
jgi:hypothetical protein